MEVIEKKIKQLYTFCIIKYHFLKRKTNWKIDQKKNHKLFAKCKVLSKLQASGYRKYTILENILKRYIEI